MTEAAVSEIKALESGDSLKPEQRFEARVVAIRNPTEKEKTPDTFILENGDVFSPADKVVPGFLSNLPAWSEELVKQASESGQASSGRRTLLAQWLTSDANPITPRVLVTSVPVWSLHPMILASTDRESATAICSITWYVNYVPTNGDSSHSTKNSSSHGLTEPQHSTQRQSTARQ